MWDCVVGCRLLPESCSCTLFTGPAVCCLVGESREDIAAQLGMGLEILSAVSGVEVEVKGQVHVLVLLHICTFAHLHCAVLNT